VKEKPAMKSACKGAALSAALMAMSLHGAAAEDLSSKDIFDGAMTTRANAGALATRTEATASADIHLSVKSWGIAGDRRRDSVPQEIPLSGFYLAHLLSGEIMATIDGETTRHSPGDYWAVKPGATMQVKALGDYAMLETTVISKQ
jgi:hypothetical protein